MDSLLKFLQKLLRKIRLNCYWMFVNILVSILNEVYDYFGWCLLQKMIGKIKVVIRKFVKFSQIFRKFQNIREIL